MQSDVPCRYVALVFDKVSELGGDVVKLLHAVLTLIRNWLNHFVLDQAVHQIIDRIWRFSGGQVAEYVMGNVHYTGIDVVNDVVRYNCEHFEDTNIKFQCANNIEDELPGGDLFLIRQMLQHLSNGQIARVLKACSKYCYVRVTEGVYAGHKARPNLDKPVGWDTRIYARSSVFLDLPPFNLRFKQFSKYQRLTRLYCGLRYWITTKRFYAVREALPF
jgi:hypothetical protein